MVNNRKHYIAKLVRSGRRRLRGACRRLRIHLPGKRIGRISKRWGRKSGLSRWQRRLVDLRRCRRDGRCCARGRNRHLSVRWRKSRISVTDRNWRGDGVRQRGNRWSDVRRRRWHGSRHAHGVVHVAGRSGDLHFRLHGVETLVERS